MGMPETPGFTDYIAAAVRKTTQGLTIIPEQNGGRFFNQQKCRSFDWYFHVKGLGDLCGLLILFTTVMVLFRPAPNFDTNQLVVFSNNGSEWLIEPVLIWPAAVPTEVGNEFAGLQFRQNNREITAVASVFRHFDRSQRFGPENRFWLNLIGMELTCLFSMPSFPGSWCWLRTDRHQPAGFCRPVLGLVCETIQSDSSDRLR